MRSDLQDFNGTVSAVGGFFASAAIGAPTPMAWLNMDVMARNVVSGRHFCACLDRPTVATTRSVNDGGPLIEPGARRYNQGQAGGSCADDVSEWAIAAQETVRNSFAGTFEHRLLVTTLSSTRSSSTLSQLLVVVTMATTSLADRLFSCHSQALTAATLSVRT